MDFYLHWSGRSRSPDLQKIPVWKESNQASIIHSPRLTRMFTLPYSGLRMPPLSTTRPDNKRIQRQLKRATDVLAASVGLGLASPVIALTAIALRLSVGAPVLFRQIRPGLHGRPFELIKFRTMRDSRQADGTLLPDDARLTRIGRLVRSTSLDELPQLWNVLKGDMSLVGPRPLLMQYLERYSPEQARRHDAKPGITGWAQVNGRNSVDWAERFSLDVWYVDNWSLLLDARILLRTVTTVLRRQGVSRPGHATMPEFMGPPNAPTSSAGAHTN